MKEASALIQSDCCVSQSSQNTFANALAVGTFTVSKYQQLKMISYLTFISCTLCSFANG